MTEFERDLQDRLHRSAEQVTIPPGMAERVIRRARIGRFATGSVGVVIVLAVAVAILGRGTLPDRNEVPGPTNQNAAPIVASRGRQIAEGCGLVEDPNVPERACEVWLVENDFDGDGEADRLYTYGFVKRRHPEQNRWFAKAMMATGESTRRHKLLMAYGNSYYPFILGAADPDGDQLAEAFVKVAHGATNVIVGILAVGDGEIVRITDGPIQPLTLAIAGSSGHLDGVECKDVRGDNGSELLILRAQPLVDDFKTYDTTTKIYEWRGESEIEQVGYRRRDLRSDDPRLERFGRLNCFGLTYPD